MADHPLSISLWVLLVVLMPSDPRIPLIVNVRVDVMDPKIIISKSNSGDELHSCGVRGHAPEAIRRALDTAEAAGAPPMMLIALPSHHAVP